MLQSSISGWLKKPDTSKQHASLLTEKPPSSAPPATKPPPPPPPPPKSTSAPLRMPASAPAVPRPMANWNDIPDDFLQAPSRPRCRKSPRAAALSSPKPAIPPLFALRPLPSNVDITALTDEHLPAYKRLNALTLPVAYPESFYIETMTEPHLSLTLVALWRSSPTQPSNADHVSDPPRLVGAVRCRLLPSSQLYISTIGILAPYRSHGIAMHLLQAVVRKAVELHSVTSITAHVWEANEEGLDWYKKRNFELLDKEDVYYRKLKPPGAFLVRKSIGVGDLLGTSTGG